MRQKLLLVSKIYPWYAGLSDDLIFYIAINTIWLTTIKGFNASEITFLTTISSLFAILFQIPILTMIKKLGNTKAIRIGSFCLLISSIMLTFCNKYIYFGIANIFLEISITLGTMSSILIKNNLTFLNYSDNYIKIRSKASFIYALATAVISLFIGLIFNIHQYLPMLLGIMVCFICFILSFFLFDIDEIEKKNIENNNEGSKNIKKGLLPKPLILCLFLLIFYGIIFAIVVIGQQNGKLLIQYELLEFFSLEKVTIYLGIVLFISRMVRVLINYLYPKIYIKFNNKMVIVLSIALFLALFLILIGFYLNINILIKIIIMTLGFSFFPSLRDPIKIFCQNFSFENFDKNYHTDILAYLNLFVYMGKFILSLLASFLLLKYPLQYLFIGFIIICPILIYLAIKINILRTIKN